MNEIVFILTRHQLYHLMEMFLGLMALSGAFVCGMETWKGTRSGKIIMLMLACSIFLMFTITYLH